MSIVDVRLNVTFRSWFHVPFNSCWSLLVFYDVHVMKFVLHHGQGDLRITSDAGITCEGRLKGWARKMFFCGEATLMLLTRTVAVKMFCTSFHSERHSLLMAFYRQKFSNLFQLLKNIWLFSDQIDRLWLKSDLHYKVEVMSLNFLFLLFNYLVFLSRRLSRSVVAIL